MRDEPYPGMGKVSKSEGLYLKKKKPQFTFYIQDQYANEPIPLLDDPEAKANDKLIYLAISSFVNRADGTAFPKQERMTKRASRCRKTINKTINHLVKIGWATTIRRGQGRSNITILHGYKGQKFTKKELKNIRDKINHKTANFLGSE